MYNTNFNNWHLKPKNSVIYTPKEVSEFLFNLLKDKFLLRSVSIFDPCCGKHSLLEPWKKAGYHTVGIDIQENKEVDIIDDFFSLQDSFGFQAYKDFISSILVLCNPPFNGNRKKLASEVWFDKIMELFGKDIPIVFFAPIGFRLNSTLTSKRYLKFVDGTYPKISSQIALPRNIYNLESRNRKTEFHSEILIFNIKGLEPHYFFRLPKAQEKGGTHA